MLIEYFQNIKVAINGTIVKSLLQEVLANKEYSLSEYTTILTYTSETNQTTIIDLNTDDLQEIVNLSKEIENKKQYYIDIQDDSDIYNNVINIIIERY